MGTSVCILAVAKDADTLRALARAVAGEGDNLLTTMDIAEAIATAASERPSLAFVDVTLEAGAGLALFHHLPAVCEGISVYAMVPSSQMEIGTAALSLGAAGLVFTPLSGDADLRAVNDVRGRLVQERERANMNEELTVARKGRELVERVAHLLQVGARGDRHETAGEILRMLLGATGARRARIEIPDHANPERALTLSDEAAGMASYPAGKSKTISLSVHGQTIGIITVESPHFDVDLTAWADVAAGALALSMGMSGEYPAIRPESSRIYSLAYFEDTAQREIEKARRHGRRLAIAAVVLEEGVTLSPSHAEEVVLGSVRETDLLARRAPGQYLLLLPETDALGAHTCRRRIVDKSGQTAEREGAAKGAPLWLGIAVFPHDGKSVERLSEIARRRAAEARRSSVYTLSLEGGSLGQIIDAMLACPILDAGQGSPFPLDLSIPAAQSLVAATCREVLRGGAVLALAVKHSALGLSAVVRPSLASETARVALHEVEASQLVDFDTAEAIVLVAEHGTWTFCGRRKGARVTAVHSADPLIADLVSKRLALAGGVRLA